MVERFSRSIFIDPPGVTGRPIGLFRVVLASWFGVGSRKLKANINIFKAMQCLKEETCEGNDQSIFYLTKALRRLDPIDHTQELAIAMNNYVIAHLKRQRGSPKDNVELAIKVGILAAEYIDYNRFPTEWSSAMLNLGIAFSNRLEGEPVENLNNAVRAFERALRLLDSKHALLVWASLIDRLGTLYRFGSFGERAENIEKAIQLYEYALYKLSSDMASLSAVWPWKRTFEDLAELYEDRVFGDPKGNRTRANKVRQSRLRFEAGNSFSERQFVFLQSVPSEEHEVQGWRRPKQAFGGGLSPSVNEFQVCQEHPVVQSSQQFISRMLRTAWLLFSSAAVLCIVRVVSQIFLAKPNVGDRMFYINRGSLVISFVLVVTGALLMSLAFFKGRWVKRLISKFLAMSTNAEASGALMQYVLRRLPYGLYLRNFRLQGGNLGLPNAPRRQRVLSYALPVPDFETRLVSALDWRISLVGVDDPGNIFRDRKCYIPRLNLPDDGTWLNWLQDLMWAASSIIVYCDVLSSSISDELRLLQTMKLQDKTVVILATDSITKARLDTVRAEGIKLGFHVEELRPIQKSDSRLRGFENILYEDQIDFAHIETVPAFRHILASVRKRMIGESTRVVGSSSDVELRAWGPRAREQGGIG